MMSTTKNIMNYVGSKKINLDTFKANKKPLNENLTHSSGCKFVMADFENTGKYGTCYKKDCFHAHSLQQWKPARCNFNGNCRNEKCTFYHPILESIDMWLERTNSHLPNLPESLPEQLTLKQTKTALINKIRPPKPDSSDEILEELLLLEAFSPISSPTQTKPTQTDPTPIIRCSTQELLMFAIQECVSRGIFNIDAQLSDASNQVNIKHIVVTVPTENIAKFTIKAFFDMGQFDIDIKLSE